MIICFSGTGNSRMVADTIQKATDEDMVMFAPGLFHHPEYIKLDVTDDRVLWVAPVYAWSLPKHCIRLLKKARLRSDEPVRHHLILTCGDDIGYADSNWRRIITKRGWTPGSVFSVQMPNTFVGLKGFDTDPEDVVRKKLDAMPDRVNKIIDELDKAGDVTDVVRGSWPHLKTSVLSPLFYNVLMSPSHFHTNNKCMGCGKCARNCPVANITMVNGRPQFGKKCTLCFRCYHICNHNAIQYANATKGKGQYLCPGQSFTP